MFKSQTVNWFFTNPEWGGGHVNQWVVLTQGRTDVRKNFWSVRVVLLLELSARLCHPCTDQYPIIVFCMSKSGNVCQLDQSRLISNGKSYDYLQK